MLITVSKKIATGWGVAMGGRIMVNIIAIGRIGILGVGLGIGAALAGNFGSLSEATAGSSDVASGSYDIAAILTGGTGDATATGGNFLVDILPSLF